ncbi:MAG: hypothetical protein ACRDDY_18515 [Clostridium sp.]|uniref:hypothetical protein n=1 Tax=Clostridium sp. TaxID=1506 RepID=UPI003EE72AC2
MISKEMNWLYAKENYGRLFKETFNKESEVLDLINMEYKEAKEVSYEDLVSYISRLEKEMGFMVENKRENLETVLVLLTSWCMNMAGNFMHCIDLLESECE